MDEPWSSNRDIRKPLDVTKEALIAHHARLFTLPQFAVLAADLLKARGEPTPMLYGWAGSILPVDEMTSQDCFFDLVDFAKRWWNEQYHKLKRVPSTPLRKRPLHQTMRNFSVARATRTGIGPRGTSTRL